MTARKPSTSPSKKPSASPSKKSKTESSKSITTTSTTSTKRTVTLGGLGISPSKEFERIKEKIRRSVSKSVDAILRETTATPISQTTGGGDDNSRRSQTNTHTEYSDNEDIEQDDRQGQGDGELYKSFNISNSQLNQTTTSPLYRNIPVPSEFGGLKGVILLLLLLTGGTYYLQWCCTKGACEFKKPNLSALSDWRYISKIFKNDAVASYIAFTIGVWLLSLVPIGKKIAKLENVFLFNSLFVGIVATIALIVGEAYNFQVVDFIYKNYYRFCIFSLFSALINSVWCFVFDKTNAQGSCNSYAKSGRVLVDFFLGREINPKWLGIVNSKLVFNRIAVVSTLILVEVFIWKNLRVPTWSTVNTEIVNGSFEVSKIPEIASYYWKGLDYDLLPLSCALILLAHTLDQLVFEHHLTSSFELQHEGVGAGLLLRYAVTPFFLLSIPKYSFEHQRSSEICVWGVAVLGLLALIGLVLKRTSNAIKYRYRINQSDPAFNNVETVHTFQGRRLLLGKVWGRVRQPNYVGDILVYISLIGFLAFKLAWPPLVSMILCIVFLIHRATRTNARNFACYSSAWTRYCQKVKYYFVPKVY